MQLMIIKTVHIWLLTKVEYGFNAVAKSPFLLLYLTGSNAERYGIEFDAYQVTNVSVM